MSTNPLEMIGAIVGNAPDRASKHRKIWTTGEKRKVLDYLRRNNLGPTDIHGDEVTNHLNRMFKRSMTASRS